MYAPSSQPDFLVGISRLQYEEAVLLKNISLALSNYNTSALTTNFQIGPKSAFHRLPHILCADFLNMSPVPAPSANRATYLHHQYHTPISSRSSTGWMDVTAQIHDGTFYREQQEEKAECMCECGTSRGFSVSGEFCISKEKRGWATTIGGAEITYRRTEHACEEVYILS